MPGDVYWTDGAGDGNWATAGNWSTTGAASPGSTPPANGDTATIGTSNRAIIGGTVATTTLTIKVLDGFGGTIGADTPLIFSNGTTSIVYGGRGFYANFGGGTHATVTVNISGGQQCVFSSGTLTVLTTSGGSINIAAATVVTTLQNVGADVTAGYNATVFTTATNAGSLKTSRSCTTLNAKRGTVTQYNNGVTTFTLCTTVNIENGAVYNKQSGGTDTTVNVFPGGLFTIVGNSGGANSTVTATTTNIWGGSRVIDVSNGITLTTTKVYIGSPAAATV